MLSVLIPTYNYNVTPLVTKLYKQLLNANVNFEVLVIDDASKTHETIINNKQINLIKHCSYHVLPENIGRNKMRTRLAKLAKYEWLLFLDADTYPVKQNFIKLFIDHINIKTQLIFGGIAYQEEFPEPNKKLRWFYGKKRETLSMKQRLKKPYLSVNSGCLFIRKSIFLKINEDIQLNRYGLDILFSQKLQDHRVHIAHIENPVYHNGLEDSKVFLNKMKLAVKTIVELEKKQLLNSNYGSIQKSFTFLNSIYLTNIFKYLIHACKGKIEQNLLSNNPKLFLLDLYKLEHYITLKSKSND